MERKAVPETFHHLGKAQESKWIYLFLKGKHCSICHLPWIFHLSSQKHYKSISILTFIHLFICVFPSKPINNQPPQKSYSCNIQNHPVLYSLHKKRAHEFSWLTWESVLRSDFSQTGCQPYWIPNLTAPCWRFNHKHGALEILCRLIASIWVDRAHLASDLGPFLFVGKLAPSNSWETVIQKIWIHIRWEDSFLNTREFMKIESALYIHRFHICGFNKPWIKHIFKKFQKVPQSKTCISH